MARTDNIKKSRNSSQRAGFRTEKTSANDLSAGLSKIFPSVVQALADPSRDIVLLYDMDRQLQYVSLSFEKLTGYTVSTLKTNPFIDYVHPEDQNALLAAWDDVFGGKEYQGRFRCITMQNAVKDYVAVWKPVCDDGGRQIGVLRKETELSHDDSPHAPLSNGIDRYLTILDDLDISYFELDLKGNFTLMNDVTCRHLGYSREELLGMNYRAYYKPDNFEHVKNIYREIYRTGKPKTMVDYEVLKKDGTPINIRLTMTLMRDLAGEAVGFMGLALDITDRIGEEQRFRQTAEKYQAILKTMEEGYLETDLNGNYTVVNEAACRMLGYTHEEAMGTNYRMFHPPEVAQHLRTVFSRIYETGKPELLLDYAVLHKNGSRIVLQSNAALVRNSEGKPTGFRILSRDITEHKKAEDALRQSEERYRSILDTMAEGLFETDLRGAYTFVNEAACRLMGYQRDELIGKNFRMCHKPDTIRYLQDVYSRMYRTGRAEMLFDYEAVLKDGSNRIHQANTAIIRDQGGDIIGFSALVRDITDYKRAEEALRESEERYRTVLEAMDELFIESDLKGNYTFVNDAACRLLGYTHNEMIGIYFRKLHPPEVVERIKTVYKRIYETGEPVFLMDAETICKDGSVKILQINVALMRDPGGTPTGFRVLGRDITENKKAEEALRESEEKYRTILETMDEGLFENDLTGTYTFINDAACRLIGYERGEILGEKYRTFHTPETARYLKEVYSRMYKTGQVERLMEYEAVRKDGSIRIHQANTVFIRNQAGEITGFRALVRDITEKIKAEEERAKIEQQLQQAQKMESVGRLAGGVAHDFNNMITVILGYAELIKLRLPPDSSLLKDIGEIEKAAIRSRDMTRQLLAFSRKAIIAPKNINLNSLIADTQKTILRLLGEDIDLKFYPGKDLWKIKVDPSQMEQILINLAVNARDSMPHGGKLTIETENVRLNDAYCKMHAGFIPGYYALLGVSDEGIGMDKETLQQIFEPFFTTKEMGKGTGLGLSMVYGIVQQNNGFINVYSEPGKGTTFKIYIPRSDEEIVVQEVEEEPPAAASTGTILLVEDDNMVRRLTTDMLEAIGYQTVSAGSPHEAMALIEKHEGQIDLIITDVVMPGMSGKELIEKIEAVRPGMRVLYMSGYTTNVIAHRGVLDEGVNFIQKPFSIGDLARKINSILK